MDEMERRALAAACSEASKAIDDAANTFAASVAALGIIPRSDVGDLEAALRALLDEWELSAKDAESSREFALLQVRRFYNCPNAFGWRTGTPHEWLDKAASANELTHRIITMSEQLRRIVEAHFQTGDRDV
jgi:hypothetical protein